LHGRIFAQAANTAISKTVITIILDDKAITLKNPKFPCMNQTPLTEITLSFLILTPREMTVFSIPM
jgi:hypothetical protein